MIVADFRDKKTYELAAKKAWNYLANVALQPDGKVGYVQPIGEKAIPGQIVDANSTAISVSVLFYWLLVSMCVFYRESKFRNIVK